MTGMRIPRCLQYHPNHSQLCCTISNSAFPSFSDSPHLLRFYKAYAFSARCQILLRFVRKYYKIYIEKIILKKWNKVCTKSHSLWKSNRTHSDSGEVFKKEDGIEMYFNSGYLNNSRLDFKDYTKPLVVGSCGTYRLKKRPMLPTYWKKGRRDYQILYVASGKAHFWFNGIEEIVDSGHMVLYKPKDVQKYVYYVEEHPEVFWVHFTGYDVKNILEYHGISLDQHVFFSGTLPEYKMSFRKIIRELQQCEYGYEDYIASLFNNILLLVSRQQQNGENYTVTIPEEIEMAVSYFNENYNTKISVAQYAESLHISTNWFIRNFKQHMKISPAQYLLSLRMVNAQSLLENTDYSVGEIAEIVGYDNQLYFSRVFKKEYGISPAQYRKRAENQSAAPMESDVGEITCEN